MNYVENFTFLLNIQFLKSLSNVYKFLLKCVSICGALLLQNYNKKKQFYTRATRSGDFENTKIISYI